MKKMFLILAFGVLAATAAQAQRYAVIDSKYILEQLPEYKDAQKKLDLASESWQKEIDAKFQEIDRMYKSYQAEQVMLSDDMRKKREQEIMDKEKAAKDLQKKRFGYEGDLFTQRQTIVKPIQDKVYNAVQKMATAKGLDLIMDKAAGVTVFYADPKLDRSADILKDLGVKVTGK